MQSRHERTHLCGRMKGEDRVYIIAEMACSHEGDVELARTIIDGAAQAQADAIQLQIWHLPDHVVRHHPEYARLECLELSQQAWADLACYAREQYPEMDIVACVYERKSVDLCEKIGVDAYKIHSADLSNPYLLRYVAGTEKRVDLSVGASSLDEIQRALEHIRCVADPAVWLMYGYQAFPTPSDKVHLRYMMKLKQLFELPLGYQDHSDADSEAAFWLPAAALGLGVDILEKHITHDRARRGVDHEAALNPDEFGNFVKMVRVLEAALGESRPRPFSAEEARYRKYAKKSLVASRRLDAGTKLTKDDLLIMRAAELGLPPEEAPKLLGRVVANDIDAYHPIREGDVR